MKTYGQFCPVAKAAEVVAERWTPLILRELLSGCRRFNEILRGVPLMSRSLLSQRLRALERAGIVEKRTTPGGGSEYLLTQAGEELRSVIEGLGTWGARWARSDLSRGDLDAGLLMWDMHRRLIADKLPPRRVTVHFDFPGERAAQRYFWMILNRPEVDLCLQRPGHEEDLKVIADLAALTAVWTGDRTIESVLAAGDVRLEGPRELRRAFPRWLALSVFAGVEPEQS